MRIGPVVGAVKRQFQDQPGYVDTRLGTRRGEQVIYIDVKEPNSIPFIRYHKVYIDGFRVLAQQIES